MGYQSADEEAVIVAGRAPATPDDWRERAVDLVRRTREHGDLRTGSSVRGAIDLARVAVSLAASRDRPVDDWWVGLDAATVALSGRIKVVESARRAPEEIVRELYEAVFGREPSDADPEDGSGDDASGGARARPERAARG